MSELFSELKDIFLSSIFFTLLCSPSARNSLIYHIGASTISPGNLEMIPSICSFVIVSREIISLGTDMHSSSTSSFLLKSGRTFFRYIPLQMSFVWRDIIVSIKDCVCSSYPKVKRSGWAFANSTSTFSVRYTLEISFVS